MKCAGQFPGPRDKRLKASLAYGLQLPEEALGLRIVLHLLDESILVTVIERPYAAEQLRGDRHQILWGRIV
jgi:hypothetical protein